MADMIGFGIGLLAGIVATFIFFITFLGLAHREGIILIPEIDFEGYNLFFMKKRKPSADAS